MATTRFAENLYSFRMTKPIFGTVLEPFDPVSAALAAIEAKLAEADALFLARKYREAVPVYREAEALVFKQLHPPAPSVITEAPRDPELFTPLLSMAVEWMNILTVNEPIGAARPRERVDPALLGKATKLDGLGLRSNVLASGDNADALADFQMSRTLAGQGNDQASAFFLDRARQLGPELVAALERDGDPATPTKPALPPAVTAERHLGVLVGEELASFDWPLGEGPPIKQVRRSLYDRRVGAKDLPTVIRKPTQPSDLALDLPHVYFYVLPLALAECHHALGDFQTAEAEYLQAATYQFLNLAIEGMYLWQRLATLYLDWGNALFREGSAAAAVPIYAKVIKPDDTAPDSVLYTTPGLARGADVARQVIAELDRAAELDVNPAIAAVIVEVRQQLLKIEAGLDYWGFWTSTVPIWTFEYLQNVAVTFTQLAVSAERDVINFWDRADQGNLSRQQLVTNGASAQAELAAADLQTSAAQAERRVFADGVNLATRRAADARAAATQYENMSAMAISYQAASSQVSGGDDGNPAQLNRLADQLLSGHSIHGDRGTVAAAAQLAGAKLNRRYEIDSLRRQAAQLDLARTQAQDELAAADARVRATAAAATVARIRASGAQQLLETFEDQFFTPEVWQRMGDTMYALYRRYFAMAMRAARLMQQAYNFETDQSLQLIREDYSSDEVKGLLAADALMADIQTFTYDLITSTVSKPQPVKQTISLANRYPFAFEQLRATGLMEFDTRIDDFDDQYPGTYAGRLEAVEVEVEGLLPPTGISGTLTNSGISSYRVPLQLWTDPAASGLKYRVQPRETLVLSDFGTRLDALLVRGDQRQLGVFQGAGLASSWRLELPKQINDFDYGALLDVRLTFYYKARFDLDLAGRVKAQLGTRPGFTQRERAIPLRWLYPDAFFSFQDTGELRFELQPIDFPHNQTAPTLTNVGVLVVTDGSVPASGLQIGLAVPGRATPAVATTDTQGAASSTTTGSLYAALVGGAALGEYVVSITAAANPGLAPGGELDLGPVVNVVLLMEYTFTPRS